MLDGLVLLSLIGWAQTGKFVIVVIDAWLGSCCFLLKNNGWAPAGVFSNQTQDKVNKHYEEIENSAQLHAGKGNCFLFVLFMLIMIMDGVIQASQSAIEPVMQSVI